MYGIDCNCYRLLLRSRRRDYRILILQNTIICTVRWTALNRLYEKRSDNKNERERERERERESDVATCETQSHINYTNIKRFRNIFLASVHTPHNSLHRVTIALTYSITSVFYCASARWQRVNDIPYLCISLSVQCAYCVETVLRIVNLFKALILSFYVLA